MIDGSLSSPGTTSELKSRTSTTTVEDDQEGEELTRRPRGRGVRNLSWNWANKGWGIYTYLHLVNKDHG